MSLFTLTQQDLQDFESWTSEITQKNSEFVQKKSEIYSFDFNKGTPLGFQNFAWEQKCEKVKPRMSTIRYSTASTQFTLPDDDLNSSLIPSIQDQDLSFSLTPDSQVDF